MTVMTIITMMLMSGADAGHAAIVSNFIKEIARTGPELYFSQSVLLMYGTTA